MPSRSSAALWRKRRTRAAELAEIDALHDLDLLAIGDGQGKEMTSPSGVS